MPGHCPVGADSLTAIERQQTNPARWNGKNWPEFATALRCGGVEILESPAACGAFATDAGGTAYGMPHGVVIAKNAQQISTLLKNAQQFCVPVTVRGGGLTTEGESVAYGGVLLDMTGMSRVKSIDTAAMTVRTECGIFWHSLAEELRRVPHAAFRLTKQRFREQTQPGFDEATAYGVRAMLEAYATGEPQRVMRAFVEARAQRKGKG